MNSKSRGRSHLSLFRLGNQFAFKLKPTGKALAVSCLFALASQTAYSQSKLAVNALPTGGKVVAGAATISSTQTATSATMNVNQTSQRAVINWDTFNVGKNATVNFNQPNSQAVILNRVTSASASLVDGVIRANGQVMLVNPNGVNFGKGAQVHAAGVVASTLDISNKDFMEGKSTFTGNGQGKIVNEGKIVATDPNGYIALLAPEVRNQGFLIARKGTGSTIAMASGEKITLDFRGSQLIGVTVDKATYNGLIENKRVVEVNGGLVVLAAGTARELMASLISNTGKISANAIVDNGGVIDIVASNVVQAGTISANGNGANSTGGQINIVGENITVAANSKTTATGQAGGGSIQIGVGRTVAANAATSSAANSSVNTTQTAAQILAANPAATNLQAKTVTVEEGAIINASAITQGNGGAIVIWSQVKTIVNGVLSAVGGYLNGNGGLVETSSAGSVVLGKNLSVNTGAPKGSSGLWFLDPIDLTIDGSAAGVISAALTNNNVSITVAGNICPTLGNCTQNGTGSLTIASGANILKDSGNLTTLTLTSSGIFNLNADISGQNLNVIINSSIAYLNVGTSINANQVTVQAQSIFSYGSINAGNASNLGNAIQLLAQAIYVSGGLRVGSNPATSSNSNTSTGSISYNGSLIRQQDLPDFLAVANQTSVNLDQVYSAIAANQSSYIPAGVNQITLTGTQSITIAATAQLLANGTFGGSIIAAAPQINLLAPVQNNTPIAQGSGSLIQANGNNGPGGIIALTAANDFNINSATILANGSTDGGSIRLISSAGNLLLSNSLIQTNGGSGRGGSLGVSAANDTTINSSTLEATGFTKGGSIMVGYDSAGQSLPFSRSTTIDAATILSANQTDGTNSADGGLIETSGGTLVQLASINAGRGGMWLLDPYDYIIGAPEAANISALLDAGTSVSISTLNASHNFNGQVVNGVSGDGTIYVNSAIAAQYSSSSSLTFTATTIWISANITTHGAQTYNGNVLVLGSVTLKTYGADLTVTGTISGGYAANTVLSLLGNGGWSTISPTGVVDSGTLQQNTPFAMAGGTLTYTGNTETSTGSGVFTSGYTWQPLYSSSGSVLVVGAGGGGGARSGNGGSGGGVYSSALQTFNSSTTYTMSVGIGGYGGDLGTTPSGLSGGSSSIQGIVTAAGGAGGSTMNMSPSTMGGSANAGARASTSGLGADGIQSSITGSLIYYGGGGGGGGYGGGTTGTAPYYYGYGGIPSTRQDGLNNNPPGQCTACDRSGNPGQPNTGMGGGGGLYSYPFVGTGGTGGNGVVIIHAVSSADTQLTIANAGTVRLLGNVNGGALNSLNISLGDCGGCATPVASITSTISGNITGNITLNLDSYSTRNKLLLSGQNNTFAGSINIYGGTLQAVSANSFGNANNIINMPTTLTTGDLPTIDLNGISMTGYIMRLQGAGTETRGSLINSSSTAASFSGSVLLNGDASIGGPGTINLTGIVSQNGNTLSFVTGAKVSATNAANYLDTIIGSAASNVQLASQTLVTIGNASTGFTGDGSLSVYSSNGILVTKAISVSSGISLIASGLQAITINAPMIASAMRVIGVSTGVNSDGIAFGGNLVLSSSGDIFLSGSSMSPAGGRGVHLGAGTKVIAAQNLSVIGYADGSGAGNTFGIASENYGGTLLFSGGNMLLAASTPNGVSGSTSLMSTNGAAIDIHTVIKSGGNLKITAAQIGLFGNGDTFGNNVSNVATDVAAVISSPHQSGVAIENYSGVTYSGVTYSNTVVAGNIEMAASGTDLGLYIGGSLLSTGGSISLNGTSTAGGTGVMVQVTYTEPKQIITQSSSAGSITITGTSTGTTNGTGIFLWSNGPNPIGINSAKSLTLVGWAAGTGTNYGIRTSGYGTLISAGEMVLAASTPNSRYGSAIRSTYNISAGSDLTFEGATQSGAQYQSNAVNQSSGVSLSIAGSIGSYNGVSAGGIINIFGASTTNLASDLTASDGHSQNYGVDVGHANLRAGGNINITGSALGIGGGSGDYGNSGIVVGNIQAGGLLNLIGNSPDYTVYGGMTITSAGGISVNGTGSIDLRGSWTNTGVNDGIVLLVSKDVSVESLNNSGSGGIRITGGARLLAGDSAGGTIKGLGTITNTAGVVGLSMAAPSNNYAVEAAVGITSSNASTAQNVSYGKDAANFSTPNGYSNTYTNGNFINYRQAFSTSYSVTVNNNYSAIYGTTTTSDYARTWFANNSNVSLSIVGTAFGVNQQAALQSLRFGNPNDSSLNLNIVQSNTPIAQGTIFSVDGTTVNVQSNTKTYTITRAPLGISVTGAYNNSTTISPSSFSVYGLVNNEVINSLTSASVAFKDVLAGNNYVTGIVIGAGTASMSNYQLNPLGRNITSSSTLQNMVTITPLAITVTGATASNKVYDGTTTATVNSTSAVLTGKISGDDLTLSMNSGSFMSPGVGNGISVTGAGSLQGASASNYTLGAILLSANITPAPLGVIVVGTYSNSTTITPTSFTTIGLVNGETIATLTSAVVNNKNVSANGSNYVTSITKGNGTATLSNYAITAAYNTTSDNTQNIATINPKTLTVSGTAVADKVYDGTTTAVLTNGVLNGVNNGDTVTLTQAGAFSRAGVGTTLTVTAADTISDTSGNYLLQQPQTLNASITPKVVSLSAAKIYDATTSLANYVTISTGVGSETLTYTGATAYSANVSTNGTNYINAITLVDGSNGGLANNYILPTLNASNAPVTLTAKALNMSASKTYDSTTSLANAVTISGLIGSQTLNYSGATAHTANAGSTYIDAIAVSDGTNGGLAGNYQIPTLTSAYTYNNVTITPKVVTLSASKVYDGTNNLAGAVSIGGLIGSQTLNYTGSTVSDVNVTTANKYITAMTLTDGNNGGLAANYVLPTLNVTNAPVTITARPLTVSGTTVPDKVYDGTTTTTLAGGTLVGVVGGEVVNLIQSGTFASANAGNNVAVVANDSLSGNAAVLSNYTLVQPTTTTGNITRAPLTVTGTTVSNKVYDGTVAATLANGQLVGVIAADNGLVTLNQSGTFANANVGNSIAITATDSLAGSKAANYVLTQPTVAAANITPAPLGVSITNAVYQASTSLNPVGLNFTFTGLVNGETITALSSATVANANVSANGSNYVTALTVGSGTANLSNYSLNSAYSTNANNVQNKVTLTPMTITVTNTTVPDKVYDGTTTTTLAGGQLNGVFANDSGQVSLNQFGTFASPNAGNNVAVVANDSLNLTGSAIGNYVLVQPTTTTGNIIKAPLGITVTGTYTGSNALQAAGINFTVNGLLNGETINTLASVSVYDKNVSANVNNFVTAITVGSGTASMNNYALTQAYNATAGNTQNTATILTTQLTVTGTALTTKVYDGTPSAALTGGVLVGIKGSDIVFLNQVGTFSDSNVGNGIAITAANTISGAAAVNYTLVQPTGLTGNITPKALTVVGTTVPTKVYDGTTATTLSGGQLVGLVANETLTLTQAGTFASANAGTGISVVANDSISGGGVSNYTLVQPTTATGNITKAPLGITVTGVYNGSSLVPTAFTTTGLQNGETITALSSATAYSPNVSAVGNYVTAISIGSGTASMNNYALNQQYNTASGNTQNTVTITPKAITLTGSKVYDGVTNGAIVTIGGLVGSQTLNYSGATTNDANVGNNRYITAITLSDGTNGGLASNYVLPSFSAASASNSATITPKVVSLSAAKTYDATTSLTNYVTISTGVGSETLTYTGATANNANVSANGNNYINAITLANATDGSGGLASNYILPSLTVYSSSNAVTINPKALSISATKTYDSTAILTGSVTLGGLIGSQTLTYIGATAHTANAGSTYVDAITITDGTNGGLASNYQQPTLTSAYTNNNVTITPKVVTLSASKVYDGTTDLTGAVSIGGLIGNQTLTYTNAASIDPNVASANKHITTITLTNGSNGGLASNYALPASLDSTSAPVTITPKALTVSNATASNKTYDGTTAATFSNVASLVGVVGSDSVTLTQAGTFASKNVGNDIAVTTNDSISGAAATNYTLVQPTGVTANITPAPLGITVTGVYNGTTNITPTSFTTNGLLGGDTITSLSSATLSYPNVVNDGNMPTFVTAVTIGGGSASMGNYQIAQTYSATVGNTQNIATITPKAITLTATKVYDGFTTTMNNGGSITFGGLIGSETLNYFGYIFSDANVATANKYISAVTLSNGANNGIATNYSLPSLSAASASNSATVTPLTVSLVGNKTYDGTTSLTGAVTITGLVGSQTLGYTGATANSANVLGTNFINAITLTNGSNGGLASNYQLPTLTTAYTNNNVNITAKPIAISGTKVYDATTDLTNAVTITGLVGNQTLTYTGAAANSANVLSASYINAITFADGTNGGLASNYALPTLTGANTYNNATVTPAPLSLSGTKVYDGTTTGGNGTLNIGGLIGAQTLVSSNVTINDPNVGNNKYVTAVTLADGTNGGIASNYALPSLTAASARNIGSITPKDLFITLSAQTKIYGDGIAQTSNTQDGSIGLPSVSNQNGTANNTDATKPALSGIQYVNYTGNTANNSSAGFSVVGLVANDTVSTVNISSAGGALTANASVNGVSTYAIAASGAVGSGLSNYNINYVSNNYSVLTVTPRPLNVTVANATMAYGATALPNFTSTVAGLVNGDQANVTMSTAATPYTNGLAGSASNVGAYAIVASSVSNPNYYAVSTNGTLTITPINLTITAATQGGPGSPILYGTPTVLKQTVIDNALTASGLTNGDYVSGATITYNGSQTISGTSAAGTYTGGLQIASATGSGLSNYNITYQAGNLIIGKAVLTVTAANDAKLQGQADPTNFNGVIFSGFRNGENTSVVNLNGLSITRTNSTVNAVGTYTGVLQVGGIDSPNYSIAFAPGDFTIVGPGQLLVRVAPVISQYGTAPVYANPTASYIPANVVNPTANSAVSLTASISAPGVVTVTDGTSSMNMNIAVANVVNSGSGNLVVGAYGLDSRVQPATSAGFASQFTSTVMVGGLTVTPKVLTFSDFGVSGVSKVYDGSTSMSNIGFAPATNVFIPSDMVNPVANGTFLDRNVGINKGYTVGVTFAGTDAANYVMSGGAIYTADGANLANHGPANGSITQLNSVTYVGATTGGSWSDPNSWRVTNGATLGAIPDLANVANIVVNAGSTVVYDSGVIGPVVANLANAGNVNFATNTNLTISMNISGPGSVTVSGTGQLSLSGNNTYTGNSIISNGSTLIAVSGNSIGAGNIQGLGGTFQATPGATFAQINATGSLRLASDITTTGNQTYGNLVVTQARTTLLSQNGNILINGTLDGSITNGNTLLVQAPTGTVSLRGSSGSIVPINVLEVDAVGTYLYADVLTSDQQNYCGAGGCYYALTLPQVTANYCATNDCYSKNNITSAYNLLAAGTGGSGDFAKNTNIGQVYIGDNGQVGFLFNTYNAYATQAFGTTAPLFQNNPVYARTLISRDPMVNFGSFINDASANSIHTMQAAAIQVPGVNTPPTIQFNGVGNTQALFSLNALTQTVSAVNAFGGSIKNAADSTLKTLVNINFGSNAINLNNVNVITPTLNVVVPPNTGTFTAAGASITTNNINVNGRPTIPAGARVTAYTPVTTSTGVSSRAPVAPAFGSSRTATRIMAAISQQTKLDRKYDVEASVDIGDIETEEAPADKSDETDPKKKKKRTTS